MEQATRERGTAYGRQRELVVALSFGSTEVTAEHDPTTGILQVSDGGERLLQARCIGNFASALVLHGAGAGSGSDASSIAGTGQKASSHTRAYLRNVEVHANEHTLVG